MVTRVGQLERGKGRARTGSVSLHEVAFLKSRRNSTATGATGAEVDTMMVLTCSWIRSAFCKRSLVIRVCLSSRSTVFRSELPRLLATY